MKISNILSILGGSALVLMVMAGCKKTGDQDNILIPEARSSFANISTGSYYIKNDPNSVFKIPVGITTLSSASRNVTVTVSSPTGATSGVQYTLPSTTVTIPANKALDSLAVKGIFAGYAGTRRDTLVFTINGGDVPVSVYNNVYKLILQKYCDVSDVTTIGAYANTRDYDKASGTPSAAKYTATISNFTLTSATTATVLIKNLGNTLDIGFAPFAPTDAAATGLTATLDWSNPSNFTVSLASQPYVASLYTYGASTISGSGTFSSCDQTMTITYTIRVSAGSFPAVQTNLVR